MPKLTLLASRVLQNGEVWMRVSAQSLVLHLRRQRPKVREAVHTSKGWVWLDTGMMCHNEDQQTLDEFQHRLHDERIARDIRAGRHNNLGGTKR